MTITYYALDLTVKNPPPPNAGGSVLLEYFLVVTVR